MKEKHITSKCVITTEGKVLNHVSKFKYSGALITKNERYVT